ncbi:MAG TPA: macro domain-containing protein [Pseudonocardia sp.]|jgi:O-acetyl-ADP-ribose deacetylase (regulator of RNase III)|uniref:macro domain-containing protein n=1 Tax=Pseudonocardia sp. TaxID=60912 RepID=UPI002B4AF71C|nr:macro domain-containing protein [Pseudonocardia sp.]HLU57609.1 macro domain-containing protein [Pseudonocardia sp.]
MSSPTLVLVAVDEAMARAWRALAETRAGLVVHEGSITDVDADAVVSPANSLGIMVGGIDGVYARWFPGIADRVRAASGADRGGELPVGEAVIVPTGIERPAWLISAPTMSRPGQRLPKDGGAARAAAGAVLRLWRDGSLPDSGRVRDAVRTIALPGLGTGVGGLSPEVCAQRVGEAIDEVLGQAG